MPLPAIVSAVAPAVLGGITQGLFGQASANTSMSFQKFMAKNAHQMEVEDLKKAGLNPILSAHGKGASASGGAQAKIDNPAIAYNQAKLVQAQTGLLEEQKRKAGYEADTNMIAAGLHRHAYALGKSVADLTPAELADYFGAAFGNSAKDQKTTEDNFKREQLKKRGTRGKDGVEGVPPSFHKRTPPRNRKPNKLPRKRHPLEGSRHPY